MTGFHYVLPTCHFDEKQPSLLAITRFYSSKMSSSIIIQFVSMHSGARMARLMPFQIIALFTLHSTSIKCAARDSRLTEQINDRMHWQIRTKAVAAAPKECLDLIYTFISSFSRPFRKSRKTIACRTWMNWFSGKANGRDRLVCWSQIGCSWRSCYCKIARLAAASK